MPMREACLFMRMPMFAEYVQTMVACMSLPKYLSHDVNICGGLESNMSTVVACWPADQAFFF